MNHYDRNVDKLTIYSDDWTKELGTILYSCPPPFAWRDIVKVKRLKGIRFISKEYRYWYIARLRKNTKRTRSTT